MVEFQDDKVFIDGKTYVIEKIKKKVEDFSYARNENRLNIGENMKNIEEKNTEVEINN